MVVKVEMDLKEMLWRDTEWIQVAQNGDLLGPVLMKVPRLPCKGKEFLIETEPSSQGL
jgi:hypothetical protein